MGFCETHAPITVTKNTIEPRGQYFVLLARYLYSMTDQELQLTKSNDYLAKKLTKLTAEF